MNKVITLTWKVGHAETLDKAPEHWKPAQVPGAVQLDFMPDEMRNNWQYGDRFEQLGWMEDVYWTYQSSFGKPDLREGEKLYFISKGIDYRFDIKLNGNLLHQQEGMFTPVKIDLTHKLSSSSIGGDTVLHAVHGPLQPHVQPHLSSGRVPPVG